MSQKTEAPQKTITFLIVSISLILLLLVISAVMAYTAYGYIDASACLPNDENANKAKQYSLYFGISATVVIVVSLIISILGFFVLRKISPKRYL